MTQEELKNNFSKNLNKLRKNNNLTQAQLADKLNYSDKAISKWEVGSVIPDVETLTHIADFFKITVNDLIYTERKKLNFAFLKNHIFITLLSFFLVWFISTIAFFIVIQLHVAKAWTIFVLSVPISFIVLTIFSFIWYNVKMQYLSLTGLFWGTIFSIYSFIENRFIWFIFIIGAVGQILITLWVLLLYYTRKNRH